jgi:3-oxoacyl-[acyl-carrier-protein] synthase-1
MASTKSLTGHSLGATGVHEAIYSLIMMNKGFIAASANITTLDPAINADEIVTELRDGVDLDSVLSNSFGFGGTNATLVMSKFKD